MQMDWIAKCFTGSNPELLKKYELKLSEVVKQVDAEKPKERTQADEDNVLAAFESAGYKIKEKY